MPNRARLALLLAVPLAACAHQRVATLAAPPAPPVTVAAAALPAAGPSPINAGLSAAATVWHLRAALNVAALACRGPGEAETATRYNAMLGTQKVALAAAQARLSDEYRAGGGDWQARYDEAMTRLYNFFADIRSQSRFCAAAAGVLADVQTLPPGALPAFAAAQLPMLDAAITGAVAPRSVLAMAAASAKPRTAVRPRLELDLSKLPAD